MQEDENRKNQTEEASEQAPEEEYAFVTEQTHRRPGRMKRPLLIVLSFLIGGVVFGLVSGLIFKQMTAETEASGSRINLTEESSEESSSSSAVTPTVTTAPTMTPTPTAAPTPTPTPEPDPQAKLEQDYASYENVRTYMADIAEQTRLSLVTVSHISSTEDWFNTTSENIRSVQGIMLADNGENIMILVGPGLPEDDGDLIVTGAAGWSAPASLYGKDPETGLRIIALPLSALSDEERAELIYAPLGNSSLLSPGDSVIAVGTIAGDEDALAFGEVTSVSGHLTSSDGLYSLISTSVYGGASSDGILLNTEGDVIGFVNSAFVSDKGDTLKALAVSDIRSLIERMSNGQAIPYLGITGEKVTQTISDETGIPIGFYVSSVAEDSPAYNAGIQTGDIIISFDGVEITGPAEYYRVLMTKDPGQEITLEVSRPGSEGYSPAAYTLTTGSR